MNAKSTSLCFIGIVGILILSLFPMAGRSQTVISIGQVQTCRGTHANVPIRAQQFNNVSAVSLSIRYDTSKLVYTGFNNATLLNNLIVNEPTPR